MTSSGTCHLENLNNSRWLNKSKEQICVSSVNLFVSWHINLPPCFEMNVIPTLQVTGNHFTKTSGVSFLHYWTSLVSLIYARTITNFCSYFPRLLFSSPLYFAGYGESFHLDIVHFFLTLLNLDFIPIFCRVRLRRVQHLSITQGQHIFFLFSLSPVLVSSFPSLISGSLLVFSSCLFISWKYNCQNPPSRQTGNKQTHSSPCKDIRQS